MRVAFVRGSAGTPWEECILKEINKNGVDALFFVSRRSDSIQPNLQVTGINARGIDILNRVINRNVFSRGFEFLSGMHMSDISSYYFKGIARLREFDVLHLVDESFMLCHQALKTKSPAVMTVWENVPFNQLWESKYPGRYFRESVFKEISMFLPVSDTSRKLLKYYGIPDNRIEVVHPGIDPEKFAPDNHTKKSTVGVLNILGISRIEYFKGISFTLRALADLSKTTRNFTYTHIGTGNKRFLNYLKHLARRMEIQDHVKFVGSVPYAEIPNYIRNSNLLVMPSIPIIEWEEQMGFSLLEAMSMEVPVVASDHPSIREVVPENCGFIVPAGNDASICDVLIGAISDPERLKDMGRNGREHVIRNYNCADTARRYVEIYGRVADLS